MKKRLILAGAIAAIMACTVSVSAMAETTDVNYDDEAVAISADTELEGDTGAESVEVSVEATAETASKDAVDTEATAVTTGADEKGSPDTGVEGVAAAAGIAVVAAGALVLARKKQ